MILVWGSILVSTALAQQMGGATETQLKGTLQVSGVLEIIDDGQVDWTNGQIQALGIGVPPEGETGAKARLMAREAAIVIAERNLVKVVHGIHISSETTVVNLTFESDVIRENVKGFIKGAVILSEKELPDGSYEVVMALNMYGSENSLARSIDLPAQAEQIISKPMVTVEPKPEVEPTPNPPEEVKTVEPMTEDEGYTGLIIDCRGLPLYRCMCPEILDHNGRNLWATVKIPEDLLVNKGLVAYYNSLEEAINKNRVGQNPLVVKAEDMVGPNIFKSNAVISDADAARIVAENNRTHFLENLAVGFLEG